MFSENFSARLPVVVRRKVFCRFVHIFGRKFRRKVSLGIQKPQETITHNGISWEPKSVGIPAGNVFKSVISKFLVVEGLVNFEIDKS
jgi:hypothetical protein